jgi:predicted nucleotidyltransferase/HEPN domain-containing protein
VKTSLDHLPDAKRQDLERVLEILFRAFEEATRNKSSSRKRGRILKVVLYGSYARGDWVDDPVGGYKSDYDLLVIVSAEELTDLTEYWAEADEKLLQAYQITHELTAPAHFIVHSLEDVNRQLTRGRPFFVDIVRDGIALYEAEDRPLARPEKLSLEEAHREAQANFDHWLPLAAHALRLAETSIADGVYLDAAFMLHQATERFYHCLLLTETLYSPKSHKLNFLRSQAERVAPELIPAWPRGEKLERRCWDLLRRAYVEARYSSHYKITKDELAWLVARVEELQRRVDESCRVYLDQSRPRA